MQTFELCVNMLSEELSYPFIKPVKQGALITNSKLVFDFLLNLRFLDACYARLNKREYINFSLKTSNGQKRLSSEFNLVLGGCSFSVTGSDKYKQHLEFLTLPLGTALMKSATNCNNSKVFELILNKQEKYFTDPDSDESENLLSKWKGTAFIELDYTDNDKGFSVSDDLFKIKCNEINAVLEPLGSKIAVSANKKAFLTLPATKYHRGFVLMKLEQYYGLSQEMADRIKIYASLSDFFKGYKCGLSSVYNRKNRTK